MASKGDRSLCSGKFHLDLFQSVNQGDMDEVTALGTLTSPAAPWGETLLSK